MIKFEMKNKFFITFFSDK